jgi:hypothetical protein
MQMIDQKSQIFFHSTVAAVADEGVMVFLSKPKQDFIWNHDAVTLEPNDSNEICNDDALPFVNSFRVFLMYVGTSILRRTSLNTVFYDGQRVSQHLSNGAETFEPVFLHLECRCPRLGHASCKNKH